jgi:periplasmic protein TonB
VNCSARARGSGWIGAAQALKGLYMIHAYGLRAASLAASALMLGLALYAAMSITTTMRAIIEAAPDDVVLLVPPQTEQPLEPRRATPRPLVDPESRIDAVWSPPLQAQPTLTVQTISIAPPGPVLIERPRWARKPDNLAAYFPPRALQRGVQGEVALDCLVGTTGALACVIVSETPRNWGFGAAALRIAGDHRMVPAYVNGLPAEGRYTMHVPFRLANPR